ncbi:MAG TPA: amino acid adenylation domain-containing protein [Streptosporangiaceae bacterium]|nr:amino acid adenylation domain-containing protein [Streptosporangiaceae bacterium]
MSGRLDDADIVSSFLRAVRRAPDRTAIIDNGEPVSYAELAERMRWAAAAIGPEPGTVGVLTSRSAGTIADLLGVLAAGGAYCPIDPGFPPDRIALLTKAAGCRTVIDSRTAMARPGQAGIPAGEPGAAQPGDPAYILFTSGSTGRPKPVVTPRRAIAAAVPSLAAVMDVRPTDTVLQFASLNWDTCFEEILTALTGGATLVFDDDAYSGSFPRFLKMIDRYRISVLDLPTAFWHEFVTFLAADALPVPASLRTMVIGGEAARPARLGDWRSLGGTEAVRLINTYGCTETTLVTHAIDLHGPRAEPVTGPTVPLGRALPHVTERIGAGAELLIGGPAVALGYRGMPEATAERFVTLDSGRFFRTGDRVRRDTGGVLFHQGRLDDDLKVRGIRVSPGEVEAQLCGHPGVAAAAVVGTTAGDHTALVAYVRPRGTADPAVLAPAILRHLRRHSPRHLVPARVVVVPELVHTASGKIDRRRTHERYTPVPGATER